MQNLLQYRTHIERRKCHQIMGSRVTEVQHQLPHQCHQGPTDLEVPGIHTVADSTAGNLEAI